MKVRESAETAASYIYDMNASSRFMLWESAEASGLPQKKYPET